MNKIASLIFIAVFGFLSCNRDSKPPQLGKDPMEDIISELTIEEKAMLLVGADPGFPRGYPSSFGGDDTLFDSQPPIVGTTKKVVPGAAGNTYGIPRLGIPSLVFADGPAGVRIDPKREGADKTFYATAFPIETMLACTWNPLIVENVGEAMGNEALEYGVDILLAPALNIHRNPLGGRNFEYYSEDPYVSGIMAAAFVNGVQSNGVGTSLKHYVANNNETNRSTIDAVVDQKVLHEIYLKGFEIAIKNSKPWTVMSAYNKVNGTYASEDSILLKNILRDEFGFYGATMTDWFAGRDYIQQIKAGTNWLMPGSSHIIKHFEEAIAKADLEKDIVDEAIEEILSVVMKSPKFKEYNYNNTPDLKSHSHVAKAAAVEGAVLLKNRNNALPLDKAKLNKVALFGIGSYETISGGTGSGDVNSAYTVSILQGLQEAGINVPEKLIKDNELHIEKAREIAGEKDWFFAPEIRLEEKDWKQSEIRGYAEECDIAILTIRRSSGEFSDRAIPNDFELSLVEKDLIKNVSHHFHKVGKKLIVLLNIGGVIETTSWNNYADAILNIWQPGQEGGYAVADLVLGEANPSGKLTMTFPKKYTDVPSAKSFPNPADNPQSTEYTDGVYVGYRHYSTKNIDPEYEFGYGLSYTTFEFEKAKVNTPVFSDSIILSLNVINTGKLPGKETVQLYIHAPGNSMDKPELELKNFTKTKLLKPGESQKINMVIKAEDLASYDPNRSTWVVEPGEHIFKIGFSSTRIKNEFKIQVSEEIITKKLFTNS